MGLENFLQGNKGSNNSDSAGYGQTNPTAGYDSTGASGNQFSDNQTSRNQQAGYGSNDPNYAQGNSGSNDQSGWNAGQDDSGIQRTTGGRQGRFENAAQGQAAGLGADQSQGQFGASNPTDNY